MIKLTLREHAHTVADRLRVTLTCLYEMRGTFPDIPLPPDIDRKALGDDAFFVTLPLARIGARSRNGRTYTRAAVEQFVAQINAMRPEGMWGHLPDDQVDTRYDPPAIRWLAATIDADGVAWGKGLPLNAITREYYRLAKATNARVGTSLVAWASMEGDQVMSLELLTVDLADPARVGVPLTASPVNITNEMHDPMQETNAVGVWRAKPIIETDNGIAPSSLRTDGVGSPLQTPPVSLNEHAALLDAFIVAETTAHIAFEPLRELVIALVRATNPADRAAVTDALAHVAADPHVREIARALLIASSGAPLRRPASRPEAKSGYFKFE